MKKAFTKQRNTTLSEHSMDFLRKARSFDHGGLVIVQQTGS
jgi:hypothetical protein